MSRHQTQAAFLGHALCRGVKPHSLGLTTHICVRASLQKVGRSGEALMWARTRALELWSGLITYHPLHHSVKPGFHPPAEAADREQRRAQSPALAGEPPPGQGRAGAEGPVSRAQGRDARGLAGSTLLCGPVEMPLQRLFGNVTTQPQPQL